MPVAPSPMVKELPQRHFPKTIPPGNYSGITWLGGDRYAVVSDKSSEDGFFIFQIQTDSITGEVLDARNLGFRSSGFPARDDEGICSVPQQNSVFISGEEDNAIREYSLDGQRTGFTMPLPACYAQLPANLGLEALSYNATTQTMWTCNESGEVRLYAWRLTETGWLSIGMWSYPLDVPQHDRRKAWQYAHGIGTVCALDDGSLLVLEREAYVPKAKVGASVTCKLYWLHAFVEDSTFADNMQFAPTKQLLASWKTSLTITSRSFANYEGMCLGPRLQDGSRVLVLVADSQNRYRGVLRDWLKTLVVHLF